ncbi:C40 family peptidase [Actinocrinis puniceicyclus]|uniref:C40 family peptidase n=1 Tax=Actinocrinis puniceicyclus TaxID=977794 RepID=A0A8J7WQA2_9ACTN|nr:C40 family peptidase [Actinocrinis puniceicyclus]MBS2965553.1 C40 family peptidase [Actinocrinis puniceicyclus]
MLALATTAIGSSTGFTGFTGFAGVALAAGPQPGAGGAANEAAVRQQVAALYQQAERDTEAFDGAAERIAHIQVSLADITAREARLRDRLAEVRGDVGRSAATEYRDLGLSPTLALLFSARPETYLDQATAATRLGDIQQERLDSVLAEQDLMRRLERAMNQSLSDLRGEQAELSAGSARIRAQLSAARQELDSLDAAQRQRVEYSLQVSAGPGAGLAAGPSLATLLRAMGAQSADSSRAARAVATAYAQLGKPYLWGAIGPNEFDCSGLTRFAWAAAGVWLPRTSQEQAAAAPAVPVSLIRAGDLVVYFSDRTHVGVYVGLGLVIHAPHSGTVVQFTPLRSMPIAVVVRPS